MQQELKQLDAQMTAMSGVQVSSARLEGHVDDVKDDVDKISVDVNSIKMTLADRSKVESQERQAMRRVLVGLSGTIVAALIAALVVILTAGG